MRCIYLLIFVLLTILTALSCLACSSIFKEPEWVNYVLADGVECTAPEMIDGDVNTAGRLSNNITLLFSVKKRS